MRNSSAISKSRWELPFETAPQEFRPLFECESPPTHLYLEGVSNALPLLSRLPRDGLAVVGTRYPQPRTLQQVRDIIRTLAAHARGLESFKPILVSGFARGIDRAVHEAAIAFGLPTVAVLGCGIDIQYPAHHAELRRAILDSPAGGLLVSEYEWKARAYASQFLARNRLIAQWTRATWVVEAGMKSGAMNTAKWARNQDRDCYATPGFPGDSSLAGNEWLIDLHHATPLWGAHSLGRTWIDLASLGPERRATAPQNAKPSGFAAELCGAIRIRHRAAGGVDLVSLLDWSTARGHSPAEFYEAYQRLLEENQIQEGPEGISLAF
jgi:DNA protecting protein DprA